MLATSVHTEQFIPYPAAKANRKSKRFAEVRCHKFCFSYTNLMVVDVTGFPVSLDDFSNAVKLNEMLKRSDIIAAELTNMDGTGGLSGAAVNRVTVAFEGGEKKRYVAKVVRSAMSLKLGLAREAYFYNIFGSRIKKVDGCSGVLASVPFAYGMLSGLLFYSRFAFFFERFPA